MMNKGSVLKSKLFW